MPQLDFLKSARTSEKLDELVAAINAQVNAGRVRLEDITKFIELVKDPKRLRRALLFL